MNREEFKKLAEEEFINNTMKHLDSALIFTYIQNLEKKAELGEHYKHLYSEVKKQKDDVVELIKARIKENEGHINARIEIYHYKNMLRMLGETDEISFN